MTGGPSKRGLWLGIALSLALVALVVLSSTTGTAAEGYDVSTTTRGLLARLGLAEPLPGTQQPIVETRLWRTLVAAGAGAALAYSGGLLQGVFRNALAAPSVLGITSGASLGATVAILFVGGYVADDELLQRAAANAPVLVTTFAFLGALAVALVVTAIATSGGRVSVPTLLLVGIAANACIGGVLSGIQSFLLEYDWEVAQAVFMWSFGRLADRSLSQVGVVWAGLAVAMAVLPFVGRELDLLAGGEEDAEALGVNTRRVRFLALAGAAVAAASAVAVAGQIAFVGLVVPHVLRLLTGAGHRTLLPLCLVGGAVFLLGADWVNRLVLAERALKPSVMMSIVGGPFFLFLLISQRKSMRTW